MTENRERALKLMTGVSQMFKAEAEKGNIIQEAQVYATFDLTDAILEAANTIANGLSNYKGE